MGSGHAGHPDDLRLDARPTDSRPSRADGAEDDPRRRHYAQFYGLESLPALRPLLVVHGNCQAESLRVALRGADLSTVRMPPVHELTRADLPHLRRLLAQVTVLVTQPVRSGYRSLPIGTADVAAGLPVGAQVLRVPVIRHSGLYPTQAIIRPPSDPSAVPPVVPYHDLRLLMRAAGRPELDRLSPEAVRAVNAHSLNELRRREVAHRTVVVSDLLTVPHFAQMRTINHPGNAIWAPLAARVRRALDLDAPPTPLDRPLLNAIHAPREAAVISAFGLADTPEASWRVNGVAVDAESLATAHLDWYRAHPDAVAAGLSRHAEVLGALGRWT